jgi:hypothetical protein
MTIFTISNTKSMKNVGWSLGDTLCGLREIEIDALALNSTLTGTALLIGWRAQSPMTPSPLISPVNAIRSLCEKARYLDRRDAGCDRRWPVRVRDVQGGTDKRPMSVRIHDQCVKESGPYDEVAINRCKFRVIQRHMDETLDRIERRGKADIAQERAKDRF